jgi:hypothetical protein
MVFQCLAVAGSLLRMWYYGYDGEFWHPEPPDWTTWSLRLTVWAAVLITIYSGWGYVQTALRLLRTT